MPIIIDTGNYHDQVLPQKFSWFAIPLHIGNAGLKIKKNPQVALWRLSDKKIV